MSMFSINFNRDMSVIKKFWHSGISDSNIASLGMKQMGGLQEHTLNYVTEKPLGEYGKGNHLDFLGITKHGELSIIS